MADETLCKDCNRWKATQVSGRCWPCELTAMSQPMPERPKCKRCGAIAHAGNGGFCARCYPPR